MRFDQTGRFAPAGHFPEPDYAESGFAEPGAPRAESGAGVMLSIARRRLLRGLPLVLVLAGQGALGGHSAAQHMRPRYISSLLLMIEPHKPGDVSDRSDFGEAYVDAAKVANVQLVLQSSHLFREVIEAQHLDRDPRFIARPPSLLQRILPEWAGGGADRQDRLSPAERALSVLNRMIDTSREGGSYAVRLEATTPDPALSARLAGAIVNTYLADIVAEKQEGLRHDLQWIMDRVQAQRELLTRSEIEVETKRRELGILGTGAAAEASTDRQTVTALQAELSRADADVSETGARYESARAAGGGGDATELPAMQGSKVLQSLRQMQAEAARQEAALAAHLGPSHPALLQAQQTAAAIDAQVAMERARVLGSVANDYRTAQSRRAAVAARLAAALGVASAVSSAEGRADLRRAEGAAEVNRNAYEALLGKLRALEQLPSSAVPEVRVISGPDMPVAPAFPRPGLFMAGGMLLGLLAGAGAALALPLAAGRIESAADAEEDLGLAVIGMLPALPVRRGRKRAAASFADLVTDDPYGDFADAVRRLRMRLLGRAKGARPRVVMVTSAVPQEGKTTVAASLAVSAAMAGLRVAMVDLDLHRASLSAGMGGLGRAGVMDLLAGDACFEELVQGGDRLLMLGAGTPDLFHAGMVESAALPPLMERLADLFDLVVIDTPPVLAVVDALFAARCADACVLVSAWHRTPRHAVAAAVAALRAAGVPLAGLVLNRVSARQALGYRKPAYAYRALPASLPAVAASR